MDNIFMKAENSTTSDPYRFVCSLADKMDLR